MEFFKLSIWAHELGFSYLMATT